LSSQEKSHDPSSWFCLLAKHHSAFHKAQKTASSCSFLVFVDPTGNLPLHGQYPDWRFCFASATRVFPFSNLYEICPLIGSFISLRSQKLSMSLASWVPIPQLTLHSRKLGHSQNLLNRASIPDASNSYCSLRVHSKNKKPPLSG